MEAYTLCETCSGFLNNLVVNTGEPPLVEKAKSLFKSCAKCSIVVNEKTLPSAKKARELIKNTNANEKHAFFKELARSEYDRVGGKRFIPLYKTGSRVNVVVVVLHESCTGVDPLVIRPFCGNATCY